MRCSGLVPELQKSSEQRIFNLKFHPAERTLRKNDGKKEVSYAHGPWKSGSTGSPGNSENWDFLNKCATIFWES